MMQIKIVSGTPEVAVVGLGLIQTNTWHEVTEEQIEEFERIHGRKLSDAFEVKKEIKPKKEAS